MKFVGDYTFLPCGRKVVKTRSFGIVFFTTLQKEEIFFDGLNHYKWSVI